MYELQMIESISYCAMHDCNIVAVVWTTDSNGALLILYLAEPWFLIYEVIKPRAREPIRERVNVNISKREERDNDSIW